MTEAKTIITAEDRSQAAWASWKRHVTDAQGQLTGFQQTLATAFAVAPVALFATGMSRAIGELDRLGDQAPKVGLTAQSLGELSYAATQNAASSELLETGLGKLSQKMTDVLAGNKEAVASFKAMGLQVTDSTGKLKATDVMLSELADKLAEMPDGPKKTALAMDFLGKSGKELIPMLNQGSAGLQQLREEFVRLSGGSITDAVEQAQEFRDQIDKLSIVSQGYFAHVAGELLPILNQLAQQYTDTANAAGESGKKSGSFVADAARTVLETVTVLGGEVKYVFEQTGNEVGAVAAQIVALGTLDIEGFNAISEAVKEDAQRAREEVDRFSEGVLNAKDLGKINKAAAELEKAFYLGSSPNTKGNKSATSGIASATKEAESEYDKLIKRINERLSVGAQELKLGRELTDMEKFEAKVLEDLRQAKGKVSEVERKRVRDLLDNAKAQETMMAVQRSELALAKEVAAERQRLRNAEAEGIKRWEDAQQDAAIQRLDSLREGNKTMEAEIATIGLSVEALAQHEIALNNDTLAKKQSTLADLEGIEGAEQRRSDLKAEIVLLERRGELLNRRADRTAWAAGMEKDKKALDDLQQESQQFYDSIRQGLADSLQRGFEAGKGFFRAFIDSLKATAKRTTIQVGVQGVMNIIGGRDFFAGTFGGGGSFTGGGNSLMGLASKFLNPATLLEGTGLGSLLGFGGATGSTMAQGAFLGEGVSSGVAAWDGAMLNSSLGSLAPFAAVLAPFLAAYADGAFSGESRSGGQYAWNRGQKGAGFVRGPDGGQIAGDDTTALINSTIGTLNTAFKMLGSGLSVSGFQAGLESSENGSWRGGVFSGGQLSTGARFGESGTGSNYDATSPLNSMFEWWSNRYGSQQEVAANFKLDLKQSMIEALQAAANMAPEVGFRQWTEGLPSSGYAQTGMGADGVMREFSEGDSSVTASKWVRYFNEAKQELDTIPLAIRDMIRGIDAEALTEEGADELIGKITAKIEGVYKLQQALVALPIEGLTGQTWDWYDSLITAYGSVDQLTGALASYYENFYSAEEKRLSLAQQIADTVSGAGFNVSAEQVLGATRAQFRALVESLEPGSELWNALMSVNGQFAAVSAELTGVASELGDVADNADDAEAKLKEVNDRLAAIASRADQAAKEFLSESEFRGYQVDKIIRRLAQAGIEVTAQEVISASRDTVKQIFLAFQEAGNLDAQEAILDVIDAFLLLQEPADRAAESVRELAERLQDLGKGIYEYVRDLKMSRGGTATSETSLAVALANYEEDLKLAQQNDTDALGRISGTAQALVDAQVGHTASGAPTQAVIDRVISDLSSLPAYRSYEQRTLDALGEIRDAINDLPLNLVPQLAAELVERFEDIDINGDGITLEEMQTALAGKASDAQLREIFALLDADGDGTISRMEALKAAADDANETAAKILARLEQDSILSYPRSEVARIYEGLLGSASTSAGYLRGIFEQFQHGTAFVQVVGGGAAAPAGGATTATPGTATGGGSTDTGTTPPVVAEEPPATPATGGSASLTDAMRGLYEGSRLSGKSIYEVGAMYGYSAGDIDWFLQQTGLPSFDKGIDRVPHDMLAQIHADEAVLKPGDARDWREGRDSRLLEQNRILTDAVYALTDRVERLLVVTADGLGRTLDLQSDIRTNTEGMAQAALLMKVTPVAAAV